MIATASLLLLLQVVNYLHAIEKTTLIRLINVNSHIMHKRLRHFLTGDKNKASKTKDRNSVSQLI